MVSVACFEKYTEANTFQRMVFVVVSEEGRDVLLCFCPMGWESREVAKWYIWLYIKDFLESASSKFLFELLDRRNGALQKIRRSVFMAGVERQGWQSAGVESGRGNQRGERRRRDKEVAAGSTGERICCCRGPAHQELCSETRFDK